MTSALQMSLFAPPMRGAPTSLGVPRPYCNDFLAQHAARLEAAGDLPLQFDESAWDHKTRSAVGLDVECYNNFFVVCLERFADGKRLTFERSRRADIDKVALLSILTNNVIITFNGIVYDMPMVYLALAGADPVRLKMISDQIILHDMKPYEIEQRYGARVPRLNHVDLMEANPAVRQGLKIIHGRLHGEHMMDLPYPPDATLTPREMNITTLYCFNDIDGNKTLYRALREPLELRVALGKEYGMDLRSKSDSQIGEAIVKKRVEAIIKRRVEKVNFPETSFSYNVPEFIKFKGTELIDLVDRLKTAKFHVIDGGKVQPPPFFKDLQIGIGAMVYTMGIGGLHSTETHRALRSNEQYFLMDVDVASQYPNIIMKLGLCPPALGPAFLQIYGDLIKDRLAAKASGDKVKADGGRIALNGVFGKLGSVYSIMYAPNLLIATTLTGQLAVLMLIEQAEEAGIDVVSANTDGVVFRCRRSKAEELDELLRSWETATGFTIERTPYKALYNSSVNTYIAIKEDGKIKRKGYIADPWQEGDLRGQMMKNPQMTICSEAVIRYLVDGVPMSETIQNCTDPRAFVTVIKVTGGAKWRDNMLGRAVRYYWSLDGDPILYTAGKRRVAKTEGARPLMTLPRELPPDVDYLRYCEEAYRLATDLGIRL